MLKDIPKIIIFSDPVCIDKIIDNSERGEGLVISFSLNGKLALEKKGLRCLFPDELIKLPDLNRIGLDNLERVKDICNFLDKKLQEKIDFLKKNNINLFHAGFFRMKVFFDTLYTSYFIIEELLKAVNKKEVILFKRCSNLDKVVAGEDSIVPAIIENIFLKKYKNIAAIECGKSSYRSNLVQALKNLKRNIYWFCPSMNTVKQRKYKYNGLILDYRFDVPDVVNDVLKDTNFYKLLIQNNFIIFKSVTSNGFSIKKITEKDSGINHRIKEAFQEALNNLEYRDMFHCNEELFYFANQCLEKHVTESVGKILPRGGDIKSHILSLAPKLLLTASCRIDLKEALLLEIVRSLNIPVVTYQEGGGAGYIDWPLFNTDVDLSDFFLVYGNGVKESPLIKRGKAQVVPVGSIYFEKVKKTMKEGSPPQLTIYVILDNFKTTTYQHYPYNGGFFSQAYNHQLKIISTLRRFREARFVLKTVKGREFLYDSFIENEFMRLETMPLSKILNSASAFILDFPSTVLQECLMTDKPIALLYSQDNIKFDPDAIKSLSKRIRISSNPFEFYDVIKALIEDVKCGAMNRDDDFLKRYCVTENTNENLKIFFSGILANVYA